MTTDNQETKTEAAAPREEGSPLPKESLITADGQWRYDLPCMSGGE